MYKTNQQMKPMPSKYASSIFIAFYFTTTSFKLVDNFVDLWRSKDSEDLLQKLSFAHVQAIRISAYSPYKEEQPFCL